MKDRDAMTALYLYRYHDWSLAEAALFFSPTDRRMPRRIAGGYVPKYGSA